MFFFTGSPYWTEHGDIPPIAFCGNKGLTSCQIAKMMTKNLDTYELTVLERIDLCSFVFISGSFIV